MFRFFLQSTHDQQLAHPILRAYKRPFLQSARSVFATFRILGSSNMRARRIFATLFDVELVTYARARTRTPARNSIGILEAKLSSVLS